MSAEASDWQHRLAVIVDIMREMSRQTDPQAMVRTYSQRVRQILPVDRMVSVSRRDLPAPKYMITRSSLWEGEVNPWKERHRLPLLEGGLLGELLYGDDARLIEELHVAPDDPAAEYLQGMGSLVAIPHFDHGVAINMVILMRREPHGFPHEEFPEMVWIASLFGRAAHNLVLSDELRAAYELVEHELQVVQEIQRSLLPAELPQIPTMRLATHYQTSRTSGGDYYDFFPLPDGRWGILIADVSGHGPPAAVIMAVTHSIAHTYPGPPTTPGDMLDYVNRILIRDYTRESGTFVTAFYGIYDPESRQLLYASAGHPPPVVKRCCGDELIHLDAAQSLPLGLWPHETFVEATYTLEPGDQLVFYTDGITESRGDSGEMFGTARFDGALHDCAADPPAIVNGILDALARFTNGRPLEDDRTLVVARIS